MKRKAKPCKECREWKKIVVDLINMMPQPQRMLICAKLAFVPEIYATLTPRDRMQAALILAAAKQD